MAQKGKRIADEVRQEYLEWLMTPPTEREPRTKSEVAAVLGVSERTLYNWEGSEEFQSALKGAKLKWGTRMVPEILGELMRIVSSAAKDSDRVSAARVLLNHLNVDVDDKADTPTSEQVAAVTKALEDAGYRVIGEQGSN